MRVFIKDQVIDGGRREGIRRRRVVMGIADDQRVVGAADDDQMNAIRDMLALFGLEPARERARRGQFRIAKIADHAEIGHDRRQALVEALRLKPHHMQFAARQAVGGDPIGVKRVKVVAWADDDRLRLKGPAAGLESRRRGAQSDSLAAERHVVALSEILRPGAGSPRATRRGFRAGYRGPRRRIAT